MNNINYRNRKIDTTRMTMVCTVISILMFLSYTIISISSIKTDMKNVTNSVNQINTVNEKLIENQKQSVDVMKNLSDQVNELQRQQQERKAKVAVSRASIVSADSDLCDDIDLTPAEMNKIIDVWDTRISGGTPFKGKGAAFIRASEETGLNPIYIFAHAATESAWGRSTLAVTKHNYFGIGAFDSNPSLALTMASSVDNGIIEGAKWIKKNYYDEGHTTLNSMAYKGNYASAKERWIGSISAIMNYSYRFI